MRILITNDRLETVSGTVAYVKDLSLGLQERGHEVALYSPFVGQTGKEIQSLGIPVSHSLRALPFVPDLIHGHHTLETVEAVLYFRFTPVLYVCHDRLAAHDRPPRLKAIATYVAVDDNCLDRLLLDAKISKEKVRVLYNFVNLKRFTPRPPLPARPQRAAIFSNYAKKNTYVPLIQQACDRMGLSLDVIGLGIGNYAKVPESLLGRYDLIFCKAKCALEAMAVGCSVICCDFHGFGGLVTQERFDLMRRYNFGMKLLNRPFDVDLICQEIALYDPVEAAHVTERIRQEASLEKFLDQIENLYREIASYPRKEGFDIRIQLELVRLLKQKIKRSILPHFPFVKSCYTKARNLFSSAH